MLTVWALAALVAGSTSGARSQALPVVLGAGPHADPSDRAGGGFRRVTFSPDGDGRRDLVRIRARAALGDRLVLRVGPESNRLWPAARPVPAGRGIVRLAWSGLDVEGRPLPAGSYVIAVCSVASRRCARTRILAHLRILTVFTPRGPAGVSPGQTIPVVLASDRAGPFLLDLVSAADPRGIGVGGRSIETGETAFLVPDVPGGLWLLRVRSGPFVTYYPLVIHERALPLDAPPPHTALVVHPYITWRAYDRADLNRDGQVDSWYSHPRRPVVPLRGPFEHLRREPGLQGREASPGAEQAFARWMDRHGLIAQHVTDLELGRMSPAVLRRYAMVVFPGHTEYYERRTYENLLSYRLQGGRLYFLQGNSFYGQVEVRRASIVRLSYRYRTPAVSDFRLAVTGFRSCCWPSWVSPRYHLAASVEDRLPWLLEGTGLRPGAEFGLAQREVDTIDSRLSPPGTIRIASATVPPFPSPGGEEDTALGWIGNRPFRYPRASARTQRIDIAYAAVGRGEVFSWGNCGFMQSLNQDFLSAAERVALDRVALNVWRRFTR